MCSGIELACALVYFHFRDHGLIVFPPCDVMCLLRGVGAWIPYINHNTDIDTRNNVIFYAGTLLGWRRVGFENSFSIEIKFVNQCTFAIWWRMTLESKKLKSHCT